MEREQLLDGRGRACVSGLVLKPAALEPLEHAGLRYRPASRSSRPRHRRRSCSGRDAVIAGSFWRSEPAAELRGLAKMVLAGRLSARSLSARKCCLGHVDLAAHLADRPAHCWPFELAAARPSSVRILAVTSSPSGAVAAGGGGDEFAALVAQRHRQAVDLRLGGESDVSSSLSLRNRADAADEIEPRPARRNALSSDSIGTA